MSIKGSVGKDRGNAKADVTVVQAALNENLDRTQGAVRLVVDGVYGENTQREIDRYQSESHGHRLSRRARGSERQDDARLGCGIRG